METARIVHAPQPSRHQRVVRPPSLPPCPEPTAPDGLPLPSAAALRGFEALATRWRLSTGQAWTMLTGQPRPAASLTPEEARRVALLLAVEAKLATVLTQTDVGAWMAAPSPAPLLMGRSPLDFLARTGTPGFLSLLRQARRWAAL